MPSRLIESAATGSHDVCVCLPKNKPLSYFPCTQTNKHYYLLSKRLLPNPINWPVKSPLATTRCHDRLVSLIAQPQPEHLEGSLQLSLSHIRHCSQATSDRAGRTVCWPHAHLQVLIRSAITDRIPDHILLAISDVGLNLESPQTKLRINISIAVHWPHLPSHLHSVRWTILFFSFSCSARC